MSAPHAADQRYALWIGTYCSEGWEVATTPRARTLLLWLTPVVVAAGGWVVVQKVSAEGWGALGVLGPQVVMVTWLAVWLRRPPQTRFTSEGLAVRSEPWRTRSVAWADVVAVRPPSRFEEHPVALLTDGERVPLVGLPVVVAEQMAAVTSVERPPAPSPTAAGVPDPDEHLDGPFQRGGPPARQRSRD